MEAGRQIQQEEILLEIGFRNMIFPWKYFIIRHLLKMEYKLSGYKLE